MMISLNIVTCYDNILSYIRKLLDVLRGTAAPVKVEVRHRLGSRSRPQTIAPMTSPWSISSRLRPGNSSLRESSPS